MRLISNLKLRFGPRPDLPSLEFQPTGMTLFVGPNNSGKSLVLREIERFCALNNAGGNHILQHIDFNFPDAETLRRDISASKTAPNENENVPEGHILVQRMNTYTGQKPRELVPLLNIDHWIRNTDRNALTRYYVSLLTIRLDGATRTTLLKQSTRSDLLEPPTNLLSALFMDQGARGQIRDITYGAFGKYFTIDALNGNHLRARLADRPPVDEAEEQALDQRARAYHRAAIEITEASDGVKAFTGMVAAVIGQKCRVPLIDEPEAFLHPPLAKRLGKELSEAANRLQASAFIATHSAHFLMGCIAGSPNVNIVRLTYKSGRGSARLLTHDRLHELIKSPLMRSTGVLGALFHEGAVVCESDSDRAFYEEINARLSAISPSRGSESAFINAHTKQSTAKIAGPLRQMGIPAAVIIDADIINDTDDFRLLLKDLDIPKPVAQGWCQTKSLLVQQLGAVGIDFKKGGLRAVTDGQLASSVRTFISAMAVYGIFVVPNGELESWQPAPGVQQTSNKKLWLLTAFQALGDDPDAPSYVQAGSDDVWQFISQVAGWINDPSREGV